MLQEIKMLIILVAIRPIRAGEYVQAAKGGGVVPFRVRRSRPRTVKHGRTHNKCARIIIGAALTQGKYLGRVTVETVM